MKKTKTKRTIVLDLDGTLETPYFDKDKAREVRGWMSKHPTGNTFDRMYAEVMEEKLPHFFLNGALELLRWIHDHGFRIVFFSNAVKERNKELCPILMERAFAGKKIPSYRILSRDDCIDTRHLYGRGERKYDGLWHGNFKKKLAGVVVSKEELPNTLMIEDDASYAARGEEKNFVYGVYGGSANNFIEDPKLSDHNGQDFHLPFYFCGLLKRIVSYADKKGVSLVEAAVQVQYGDYLFAFPRDGRRRMGSSGQWLQVPSPPERDFRVFKEGLEELRTYNPDLKFWGADLSDDAWRWPDPKQPPPPPKKEKPKVKTDMTKAEAEYWLSRLQEALRVISDSNVKSVSLVGKDYDDGVYKGEMDTVPMRQRDFDDTDYFDKTKVNRLRVYGYLPIKRDREGGVYAFDKDEGTVKYEICMSYIRTFLWRCFDLRADVGGVESSDCENWSIPVEPMSKGR